MLPPRDLCLILGASGLLRQSTAAPIDSSQPLDTGRLNLARSDATPELDRVRIRSFQDEAAFQDFNRFLASPATGAGLQPGIGRDKISLRAIDHINKFKRWASDQTSGDKSSPAISTLNQNDRRSALGEHHKRHQEQPSPPGDLLTDDSDNKKADPAEHAPPAPQATPEASKNVPKPKTSTDDGKTVTLNAWIEVNESTPKSPSSPPIVSIISSQAPAVQGHDAPKALPSANANPPTVPAGDGHGEPKAAPPPTPVGDGHGEPKAAPPPNPAADGHGEPKAAPPPTPAGDAHGEPKAAPAPTPAGDAHGEPKAAPPPNPAGDGHGEAKAPTPVAPAGDGHGEAKAPTPAAPPADGEGEAPAGDTHGQVKGSTPAPAGDTHGDVKAPAPEAGHDQVKAVQPDQNAKSSPVVPNPTDKSIGPTGTQAHSVSPSDAGPGPGPKPQGAAQKDAGANTAPQAPGNPKPEIKDLSQLTSQINKALADTGITLAIHSDPLKIEMSLTGKTPSNS